MAMSFCLREIEALPFLGQATKLSWETLFQEGPVLNKRSVLLVFTLPGMEPMAGIEPATDGLRNRCSTAELHWLPSVNKLARCELLLFWES